MTVPKPHVNNAGICGSCGARVKKLYPRQIDGVNTMVCAVCANSIAKETIKKYQKERQKREKRKGENYEQIICNKY